MSEIDTAFDDIVAGENGIKAACQVPNYSMTARHWCKGEGHWLIRPICTANSGHANKTAWWVCCDGCREVFEAMTLHCPECSRECRVEVDVL